MFKDSKSALSQRVLSVLLSLSMVTSGTPAQAIAAAIADGDTTSVKTEVVDSVEQNLTTGGESDDKHDVTPPVEDVGQSEPAVVEETVPTVWHVAFDVNGGALKDGVDAKVLNADVTEGETVLSMPSEDIEADYQHLLGWSTAKDVKSKEALFVPGSARLFDLAYKYVVLREDEADKPYDFLDMSGNHCVLVGDGFVAGDRDSDGHEVLELSLKDKLDNDALTLYAVWKKDAYTLAFDANGGTGVMEPQTVAVVDTVMLPDNVYAREGYTFLGWSEDVDANEATYVDGAEVSGLASEDGSVVTLYAIWSEVKPAPKDQSQDVKPVSGVDFNQELVVDDKFDDQGVQSSDSSGDTNVKPDDILVVADGDEKKSDDVSVDNDAGNDKKPAAVGADDGTVKGAVIVEDDDVTYTRVSDIVINDEAKALDDLSVVNDVEQPMKVKAARLLSRSTVDGVPIDGVPRSADGSNIESISIEWRATQDSHLLMSPDDNSTLAVQAMVTYALSGEHDYAPGDVTITIPAYLFEGRSGKQLGVFDSLSTSLREAPSTSTEFNWTRIDDTIVFTNTRTLDAAQTGVFSLSYRQIDPYEAVDRGVSQPISARIDVVTHLGNAIALRSQDIEAEMDTYADIISVTKWASGYPSIVSADAVPVSHRRNDEQNYVKVVWMMAMDWFANQPNTVLMSDTLIDEYDGFFELSDVASEREYDEFWSRGTGSGRDTMYCSAIAYYPLSQFESGEVYELKNRVEFTLTERDPEVGDDEQRVVIKSDTAAIDFEWHEPEFKNPEGHFMLHKYGNDGPNGADVSYKTRNPYGASGIDCGIDGWYGVYGKALNSLRDGEDVEACFSTYTIGYMLPWTLEGNPQIPSNYGRRPVTMTTYDVDDTIPEQIQMESQNGTVTLSRGQDYELSAVEFALRPIIYRANAVNLNPDGSFSAVTAGDGTVDYALDNDYSHIPPITVEACVGGTWQKIATVIWSGVNGRIVPESGVTVNDMRIELPAGTTQWRSIVTSTNAALTYRARTYVMLHGDGAAGDVARDLFSNPDVTNPHTMLWNTSSMYATDADGNLIVDFHKRGYDRMDGYTTKISVYPEKSATMLDPDYENRQIRVKYRLSVDERSYIPDKYTYDEAVADGELIPEAEGVFYDLLPLGVVPDLSTIRLRSRDRVESVRVFNDWRGSGRTMLVVRASLIPSLYKLTVPGSSVYGDKLEMTFEATYDMEDYLSYGETIHNVFAFESLSKEAIGSVENYSGEPDAPVGYNTATEGAFEDDAEKLLMTGLDSSRQGTRFVYNGKFHSVAMEFDASTSLHKDVQVNRDGRWSQGTYDDRRDVYEGGQYQYRLRMMSSPYTTSKDLILYDSLENYQAVQGNDSNDINAPRWRGELLGVDTRPLEIMGCAPVVYYSTVDNLQLSDESDPRVANAVNTDLTNGSIWIAADDYTGPMSAVHAVAVDARHKGDGSDFTLPQLCQALVILNMQAPSGTVARDAIEDNAHAYNNIYLLSTSIDERSGIENQNNFIRNDYTKVGLIEYSVTVKKTWEDDNNRDGIRPSSVQVQLMADGEPMDGYVGELDADNGWTCMFEHVPYTTPSGDVIQYTVDEIDVSPYTSSVVVDGSNVTVTNSYMPEKITVSGEKTWVGDTDAVRPSTIQVSLLANGRSIRTVSVSANAEGKWQYTFDDVWKNENGSPITYTVSESSTPSYTTVVDGMDMENTYHPFGNLVVTKNTENVTSAYVNRTYDVTIELMDNDGLPIEGTYAWESTSGATGTMRNSYTFQLHDDESVTIKELPEYIRYRVKEDTPDGFESTISPGQGTIQPNVANAVAVNNVYSATGFVNLRAKKELAGSQLSRSQFHFDLLDEQGRMIRGASNFADGSVVFGALNYTVADAGHTYVYRLVETNRGKAGYTYDDTEYRVSVAVVDNGDGTLTATPTYEKVISAETDGGEETYEPVTGVVTFENFYHAEGSTQLRAWKQIDGSGELAANQFSFELLNEAGEVIQTKTNNADGVILFDPISYDQDDAGKKFKYVVREVNDGDARVEYDDSSYAYEVTVADNHDGTLTCSQGYVEVTPVTANLTWAMATPEEKADYIWRYEQYVRDPNVDILGSNGQPDTVKAAAWLNKVFYTNGIRASYISSISRVNGMGWDINVGWDGSDWIGYFHPVAVDPTYSAIYDAHPDATYTRDCQYVVSYTITDTATETVPVFVNKYKPGSLAITKSVTDETPVSRQNTEFTFKVKLTGDEVPDSLSYDLVETPSAPVEPEPDPAPEAVALVPSFDDLAGVVTGLFTPREAYAVTDGWHDPKERNSDITNTYEWKVDNDGTLIIRPLDNAEEGVINFSEGRSNGSWSWYDARESIRRVRFEGTIRVDFSDSDEYTDLRRLFYNHQNLVEVDFTNFEVDYNVGLGDAFRLCYSLQNIIGLDHILTSDVTNATYMFSNCHSLASINLAECDISSLAQASRMFENCTSLTSISLVGCDTSSLEDASSMFSGCTSLDLVIVDGCDFSSISHGYSMFYGSSMRRIQANNIVLPADCYYFAAGDSRLEEYIGNNADMSNVTSVGYFFGTSADNLKHVELRAGKIGSPITGTTHFIRQGKLEYCDISGWHFSAVYGDGMISWPNFNNAVIIMKDVVVYGSFSRVFGWHDGIRVIDLTGADFSRVTDMSYAFEGKESLVSIIGIEDLDCSNLKNANSMFYNCKSLGDLDLSGWHPQVSNISSIFYNYGVNTHPTVNLSGWDFSRTSSDYLNPLVTDAQMSTLILDDAVLARNLNYAFYGNDYIEHLYLRGADASYTDNLSSLCYGMDNLKTVDCSGMKFNSSSVNMSSMFGSNPSLTDVKFTDVEGVTSSSMQDMFYGDTNLVNVDLRDCNIQAAGTLYRAFYNCTSLEELDLSSWTTTGADNFENMFYGDSNLQWLKLGSETILGVSDGTYNGTAVVPTPPTDAPYNGMWLKLEDNDSYTPAEVGKFADGTYVWDKSPKYLVAYDANGGVGSQDRVVGEPDEDLIIADCAFTQFDHDFVSWNTAADGSGVSYSPGDVVVNLGADGDVVTLYAQWQQRSHDVTLVDGEFEVTLPAGYTATISDLPAGTAYSIYEQTPGGWVLVSSEDAVGTIKPIETSNAEFVNDWQPTKVSAQIVGQKLFDGKFGAAGEWSFELVENNKVLQTKSTSEGGAVLFDPIVYRDAEQHTYQVREVIGDNDKIVYDEHVAEVTVNVTEANGFLSVETVMDSSDMTFNNSMKPSSLRLEKKTVGSTDATADDEFEFTVRLLDKQGMPIDREVGSQVGDEPEPIAPVGTVSVFSWLGDLFSPREAYAATQHYDVVFDANGGEFSDGTTQKQIGYDVEDFAGIKKYSHTSNISDDGTQNWNYYSNMNVNQVVSIPGAPSLKVVITYGGESANWDWACVWAGNYPNYTASNNHSSSVSGKLGGGNHTNPSNTKTYIINGDTVTFGFKSDSSGYGDGYGYYAVITPDGGVVQSDTISNPVRSGYVFQGWFDGEDLIEDVDAYVPRSNATLTAQWFDLRDGLYAYAIFDSTTGELVMCRSSNEYTNGSTGTVVDIEDQSHTGIIYKIDETKSTAGYNNYWPWYANRSNITTVTTFENQPIHLKTCLYLFYALSNLTSVDLSGLDTSEVTSMSNMFDSCSSLSSVSLASLDTSAVTDMNKLFNYCSVLSDIDFGSFDTSNVTNMSGMFYYCSAMSDIDVDALDVSNVTDMSYMFYHCSSLTELSFVGWDTSRVTTMYSMFDGCNSLVSLDVSSFNTSSVTRMNYMFNCDNLETLDISNFDMRNVTDISDNYAQMFDTYARNLKELKIGSLGKMALLPMPTDSAAANRWYNIDLNSEGYTPSDLQSSYNASLAGTWRWYHIEYDVLFDSCGGTGESFGPIHMEYGESFILPQDPYVKPGYIFGGWNTKSDGSGIAVADGAKASNLTVTNGDTVTLYAVWIPKEYTVIFDDNGADSGVMENQDMVRDIAVNLTLNAYEKPGYFFCGWNTEADGTGDEYSDGQRVINLCVDEPSITLYAQWMRQGEVEPSDKAGFYNVTLKGNEAIVFDNLPDGATYEIVEVSMPEGWSQTGADNMGGTLEANRVSVARATNTYRTSGNATIQVWKNLIGREAIPGEFEFELVDSTGAVVETVSSEAVVTEGEHAGMAPVAFTNLAFAQEGTWTYTIREKSGTDDTITYDDSIVTATVTAVDRGKGRLDVSVAYANGDDEFDNEVKPGSLKVSKVIDTPSSISRNTEFEFVAHFESSDQGSLENREVTVVRRSASGAETSELKQIVFGAVSFGMKGSESVTIQNVPADTTYSVEEQDIPNGWVLASSEETEGTIEANGTSEVVFSNEYHASGVMSLQAYKQFDGSPLSAGRFSFLLTDNSGAVVATSSNDAFGNIAFVDVPLSEDMVDHTYIYHISEVIGTYEFVKYDSHVEDVTVTVTDDGHGNLVADVHYDDDGALFVNKYSVRLPSTGLGGMGPSVGYALAAVFVAMSVLVVRKKHEKDAA